MLYYSYKIILIRCLIKTLFKICNKWNSIHKDFGKIKAKLTKTAQPTSLINKSIKKYLRQKLSSYRNLLTL